MELMNGRYWASIGIATLVGVAIACGSDADAPTDTASPTPSEADGHAGHELYQAKGSSTAPALAGHTETQVNRQVRNPRFMMPAFTVAQISDDELGSIAHFITSLDAAGHAHTEADELEVAVEMHHWMALDALKAGTREDAVHHVGHVIELLGEGEHQHRMEAVLDSLRAGETHDPEHEIEEMVAGTAAPDLTLAELHLRQALVTLAVEDLADTAHHVEHFQRVADATGMEQAANILELIEQGDLHDAEDEIQELLGARENEHHHEDE